MMRPSSRQNYRISYIYTNLLKSEAKKIFMPFDILEINIHAFFFSALDGGLHTPAALPREKRPRCPLHMRCMSLRACL
jgi:hypothetical protein